ncbi:hypothetical protein L6259_03860 [Candidatus Parcubacteria bacterium]|nr:hypothetical protein [Candidatus Parcubacteria bacterium]
MSVHSIYKEAKMIDRKKLSEHLDWAKYENKRSWVEDGHEVMLIDVRNKDNPQIGAPELYCECDFDYEIVEKDGVKYKMEKSDPRKCPVKKAVCQKVVREWQNNYGDYWKDIGKKEAVMDIFRKVEAKDYLGQFNGGLIYLQEVAELLGVEPFYNLLKEVGELYAEERLDLNGNILTDFEQRFRFPSEIRHVLRFIYSDYSDTSDFFLAEIELALTHFHYEANGGGEIHPFPSGKDVFPNDWPNIQSTTLAYFGKLWLDYAKARGEKTVLDTLESAQAELNRTLIEFRKAQEYVIELEEDSQKYSEQIRKLTAENEKLVQENIELKRQLEEKEHKCEGKCAKEFADLLYVAVIKIMEKYGVRVFIGAGRSCSGKFRLTHFGVDMESRALKNILFQLFNAETELDFNSQMDRVDLMDALQKAEEGGKRMGFFLDLEDIKKLNGGENSHCGKCKKGSGNEQS